MGYVGKKTKIVLEKLNKIKKSKISTNFKTFGDMCENNETQKCPNNIDEVKNLQSLLDRQKDLKLDLTKDGKWGKKTKLAVIKFQKAHHISPALGYVGKKTKIVLEKLNKLNKIKKSKISTNFKTFGDMCENNETQKCPNNIDEVRTLQVRLNSEKRLDIHLKADGKWGKKTKLAVIKFQKAHHISPALGYVGKKTKIALNYIPKKSTLKNKKRYKKISKHRRVTSYKQFKRYVNLRRSYAIFKNKKLLCCANRRNTKVNIDVSEQRIKLYVNGKVALCAPCTTGAKHKLEPNTRTYRDKHTPYGTFHIEEKIARKHSTIFGDMYINGKKVYHGDRRKYMGPRAKYVGHTMHNWMRLTNGGIGIHASKYIKRHPGSNGCVRIPFSVAPTIFKCVSKGTSVRVVP